MQRLEPTHLAENNAASLWRFNRWFASVLLCLAINLLAYSWLWQRPYPNLRVGDPAPEVEVTDPEGAHLLLSQQGGAVLINFVSVDCSVCGVEIAALDKWRRDSATPVWIVAADAFTATEWQEKRFPIVLDPDGAMANAFTVRGYPASFLVQGGVVQAFRYGGPVTQMQLDGYLANLEGIQSGPSH